MTIVIYMLECNAMLVPPCAGKPFGGRQVNWKAALADLMEESYECCRFHPQRSDRQRNSSVHERHAGRTGLWILGARGHDTRPPRRRVQIARHLRVRRTAARYQGLLGLADDSATLRAR